ncbi:MAG: hypothetical protein A2W25_12160 [candidate division Zixibacteria bacterium RBG_16_53_22]|nr:MAG: hypothetical protein A2W25_12160 [candidate division Zixibacteria bacterium RBG_16_53_22]
MQREMLEDIADRLYSTNKNLATLLNKLGIDAEPDEVEKALLATFSFGLCAGCGLWSDGLFDERCEACRMEGETR